MSRSFPAFLPTRALRLITALVLSLGLTSTVAVSTAAQATATTSSTASTVINAAQSKAGATWVWGAEGPNRFDCSGLVQWSFARAGIDLPRSSRQQHDFAAPIGAQDARAGDLVFFSDSAGRVYHVAIYMGDNTIVHTGRVGGEVRVQELWTSDVEFGRVSG